MKILEYLINPYIGYSWVQILLEFTAVLFGLMSVLFSSKRNIWVYPTGIISTIIYVYILYKFGLWGDMLINVYYTIMSVYGWVIWAKSTEGSIHVKVSWASRKEWIICGILFLFSMILITVIYYYKPYINNNFSLYNIKLGFDHMDWANYMDILTTSIFLAGMFLMAKKRIENWWFWILGDAICVPMMFYKELGITAIQYLVFTLICFKALKEWKKNIIKRV